MNAAGAGPRAERLRARLEELGAATFLVTNPVNVAYLTGFRSSNAALIVSADRMLLATDGRYAQAARSVAEVEVVVAARELLADLARRLEELAEPPVAFESTHVTYANHEALAASGLELRPVPRTVEELRAVKDEGELDAVRRAARVTDGVFERLSEEHVVGRTEAELAWWCEQAIRDGGGDAAAFPPIVASGPNAAVPHHDPGERRIERGEMVIVDLGAALDGYASDCTRTFATGDLRADLAEAYELCRAAQEDALAAVRAGAAAREVDGVARGAITGAGHEVLHGLGHGVGLEVHELPRLADTSDATLVPGNVVTVEPGVYLPGQGGVRIEDLAIVTEDGAERLSAFTKDLVALG